MLKGLSSYEAPDNVGGEQDYISKHFGLQAQLGQLDLAQNYQIHQLSQTAVTDHQEGRWISLANRPDEIRCYHFSAVPKPSHLMLGEINQ